MMTQVIVLNGGSSSGKSTIARALQTILPDPWLAFSVDTLVEALPPAMRDAEAGLVIGADGSVNVGPEFAVMDGAWTAGIAAMARAGARVVVDDVFIGQAASRRRWQDALAGLAVLWVGVRCDPAVAAAREAARGDRPAGMAASQAAAVHQGVAYDVEVDTTHAGPLECARAVAAHVARP
ncbi:chloramphenicol phosphotransferase CPT [Actinomadura sp. ATCC 31491]|uniref:Chloramphenicol phosphotransferase CPT n=1 Tax=Actinomadura luzonensis TaxID=2805427 RepID=A0ABT0FTU3_9ACTN|nr:chloramphenicol phosphotransferase CPT [Actinomadura luzonensis]MCK2215598.1 chloramphenicol phosphotransferase CPT [Actinomadura luzonensis]